METESQQQNSERLRKNFGKNLRLRMNRLNVQVNELAEKLGVGATAVTNWRNGDNLPKGKNMRELLSALDCSKEWLFQNNLEESGAYELKEDRPVYRRSTIIANLERIALEKLGSSLFLLLVNATRDERKKVLTDLRDVIEELERRELRFDGLTEAQKIAQMAGDKHSGQHS